MSGSIVLDIETQAEYEMSGWEYSYSSMIWNKRMNLVRKLNLMFMYIMHDFVSDIQTPSSSWFLFTSHVKIEFHKSCLCIFHLAFGAIAFSFGGTAAFPTIQCDMRQPSLFNSSIIMAYLTVLAMYLPVSILGFFAFGDDVQTNILMNLSSTSAVTKCVAALIASHLLFSFVIVVNPVSQQLEEWLNVPKGSC